MDNRWLARMALHYGVPMGLLVYAWYVHVGFLPLSVGWPIVCVLGAMSFLFVVYKFTFAVSWNKRADRLRHSSTAT